MATFVAFLTFISQYKALIIREEEDCTFTRKTRSKNPLSFDLFDCSSLKGFYCSKHLIAICVLDIAIKSTKTTLNLQKVLDYLRDRFVDGLLSCTVNNLEGTR